MEVEAAAPYKVIRLELRAGDRPAEFPLARLSQSDLIRALRTKLEKDGCTDKFAGTVLLAKDGKPIFTGAYGMADRERKIPNALSTKSRIGSMNKMFTVVSILQLVQAGKITLDDPVGKYLTDYPNKEIATKVTIQHLLTHTGGTGDFFRDRAVGYTQFGGEALRPNTNTLPYRGTSAGGGYSTVEDFLRFANALTNHKLLSEQNTDLLTAGKVDTPRGDKYAFGFMDNGAGTAMRHFGQRRRSSWHEWRPTNFSALRLRHRGAIEPRSTRRQPHLGIHREPLTSKLEPLLRHPGWKITFHA
jgi:CubicO group peptidase (beta-lactamase class C family)